MYRQLHRELAKWTTSYTKMFKGIVKVDAKIYIYIYICHFTLVIKMLMQYFFPKSNPQITTMLKPTKAQQTSTSRLVLHN
jgi:hypothetical protein